MTMKLLFRHTNTTRPLAGFARRAVILLAVLCYAGAAWGQVENISTGAIDGASKIAEYNDIKTNYPVNASAFIPAIADWYGEMRENSAGQHWNGIDTSSYWEQTEGTWGSDNWNQSKSITVHLPEGEYVLMGACRSSVNADAYISVNGTQVLTPKGNTGLGITKDGRPSFDANDTYANGTEGWGWQYRYIKFEVTAGGGADVTIAIGGGTSTAINQWMSFTQPQLFTKSTTSNGSIAGRVPIDMGAAYTFKLYDQVNGNDVYLNLTDDNAIISNTPQSLYLLKASGDNRYFLSNGIHYVGIDDIYLKLTATNKLAATLDEMSWVEIEGAYPYTGYCTISYWGGDNYVGCDNNYDVCTVDKHQSGAGKGLWEIKKKFTLTDLTQEMYKSWDGNDESATATGTTGCAYAFGVSTDLPYGDVTVNDNYYADLSKYGKLELTVTAGTPRLVFNRQGDTGTDFIEITDDTKPYVTVSDNKLTIDLQAMMSQEHVEYVHLNCIKGLNGGNVTITSAILTLPIDENDIPSKDIRPNEVTHKKSYLYQYAMDYADWELELQGLASDAESDWWDHDNKTQRVSQFEITHFLKQGENVSYLLPTAQNTNDHTMYQRWYNYDDEEDIESILNHVTLRSTINNQTRSVDYYLYKNGLVTGDGIYWGANRSLLDADKFAYAYTDLIYTNTDGRTMTVAADVSRYSDMTYANPTSPLEDNLEEPTLTMRYIYYMKDAREMATKLTQKTEGNTLEEPWLEEKTFHFPSKNLAYENNKKAGYQGEFLGLRHIFSDYWIFDSRVDENTTFEELNDHLISSRNNIVVEIYDPNPTPTGIRLGGCQKVTNSPWGDFVPQAGDVIRVYYSNEGPRNENNDFRIGFKHAGGYDTWAGFSFTQTDSGGGNGYYDTTIPNSAINELLENGFRIQGYAFTLTSIEVRRGGVSQTIYNESYEFDSNWSGKIVTVAAPSLYTLGGDGDYMGFYMHDLMHPWTPFASYGDCRFLVFRYPDGGVIPQDATNKPVYLRAYFVDPADNTKRYQLAQYTLIFDRDESGETYATLPWTSVNGSAQVQDTDRDPNKLREKAGKPIAKITFDYPAGTTYHFPVGAATNHGQNRHEGESYNYDNNQPYLYPDADHPSFDGTIPDSSPIPLIFDKSNYAFDGENSLFGAYALLTNMNTRWGNRKNCVPANDNTHGYGIGADPGYQSGFLYIDASELPGDICSAPFVGDFCPGDHLMVSGWISGANNVVNGTGLPDNRDGSDGSRSPGGITLTLKGEHMVDGEMKTETLYRFCPGMCYELDNGTGVDGNTDATHVVWQQFYFDFEVNEKYERHWIEVNNNCVSSQGGDFMLDNIEVYAIVPEVIPSVNTPLCISLDENGNTVTEMRFLKLSLDHNKMVSSVNWNDIGSSDPEVGFVVLEKYVFLEKLREGLSGLSETQKHTYHLDDYDFSTITLDELEYARFEGKLETAIHNIPSIYQNAFNKAFVGDRKIWRAKNPTQQPKNGGIMYFEWKRNFEDMPLYSFTDAVTKKSAVFREEIGGEKYIVMNGNYPELPWKINVDYYIVPSNAGVTSLSQVYEDFNICSECNKAGEFRIEPPLTVLGLEKTEDTNDYVVCEGQIPTLVTELKGYDFNGNEVPMQDINYDWWLGDKDYEDPVTHERTKLPTLTNYHSQEKNGIRLDRALSTLRIYYPDATDIDGIIGHVAVTPNPALTLDMVNYLKELVDAGELVLHQKSISVPAEPTSTDDPYFYLVACPIHDDQFKRTLYHEGPASIIKNGTMESPGESSFYMAAPGTGVIPATITLGDGKDDSKGICISTTAEGNTNPWSTQFFIRANEVIPVGATVHLEFDYKALNEASVHTQFHAAPGTCIYYDGDGNLGFTTEWQKYEKDIVVTSAMAPNNNFQSIAFDLWTTDSPNDYYFDNVVMTVEKKQYVAFFCDEPQGLRIKVGEKAPTLKTGFVPGENTFDSYDYSDVNNAVLSIRLAKKEQFETVKHGNPSDVAISDPATADTDLHFLWLPIRDAVTQEGARHVIRKSQDDNIYLASTNDPVNDKTISASMKKGSLPIVGKIVQLQAINTAGDSHLNEQKDENRLCIYFTENFEVREGYSYTLTLPFQEEGDVNTCDGNILINLKIVPDYEVWTGGAGNTDWNNDENWRRADGNTATSTTESPDGSKRNNNELYRTNDLPDESPLKDYVTNYTNYRTAMDRILRKGFAPLYCTHVLIKSNEWGNAPLLYDAIDDHEIISETGSKLINLPFPNLRDTSTPILKFDMQARHFELWEETYGEPSNKGREGDLIAEMYQINSCDEIAMQSGTELRNAHLLNYNSAWMEFKLDTKRWYLLGSPLQGTISGEWYAPTGTEAKDYAKQMTTYYEPVTFGSGYDRYSPAIYQRSWDKAKAVLYEVGSTYSTGDDSQTENLGNEHQGVWTNGGTNQDPVWQWQTPNGGADEYLDRLGYKPMVGGDGVNVHKANVAIKGIWSNTYNDAQVDYATGGFSVMVMNHLKGNDADVEAIIRLPKEDTFYDYYGFDRQGSDNVNQYEDIGTNTQLSDVRGKGRALNRGRLKADLLLPEIEDGNDNKIIQKIEKTASRYGDQRTYTRIPIKEADLIAMNNETFSFTENVSAGVSDLGFYLVENPFTCGLDMAKFFEANSVNSVYFTQDEIDAATPGDPAYGKTTNDVKEGLLKKYWLLTKAASGQNPRQVLVQQAPDGEWITSDGTNFGTAIEYPNPDDNTQTLEFYPNAVVAPGQGFFVQATGISGDLTVTFNRDMQAQSRFGVKDNNNGEPFTIVVGQTQVTEKMYDSDDDGTPDTAIPEGDAANLKAGDTYTVGNEEKIVYEVPQYTESPDPDNPGQTIKIPVLSDIEEVVTIYHYVPETLTGDVKKQYPLLARTRGGEAHLPGLVITAQRGSDETSALVMQREDASDDFLPTEDTEVFITSDFESVPTVYTLCGRLATTINSIHDFRSLPLGVESSSDAPCVLTFKGVEMLGDSVAFYDALEQTLTPLKSGMQVSVSGQTQNRYYLVRSLSKEEAAAETHIQIFTEGLTAKVIASTAEPIVSVRCFDTAGRLLHRASPQTPEYSFDLPMAGIYIIEAETENDRKTKKVMVK